jgi:hypothetical protein
MPFVCVGLDWTRPLFLFQKIALIKWSGSCRTDRSTSRWKNKHQRAKRKRKRSKEKTLTSINQPYELTTPSTTLARNA